jgi:hypothetical protein
MKSILSWIPRYMWGSGWESGSANKWPNDVDPGTFTEHPGERCADGGLRLARGG